MSYTFDRDRDDVRPTPDHKPTEGERAAERRARIETLLSVARQCRAMERRVNAMAPSEIEAPDVASQLAAAFEDLAARLREGIEIEL